MKKVDMSESAVLRRLKQVDQLRELSLTLMKAKPISDESSAELREQTRSEKRRSLNSKVEHAEQIEHSEQIKLPNVEQD